MPCYADQKYNSDGDRTRTCGIQFRKLTLYPLSYTVVLVPTEILIALYTHDSRLCSPCQARRSSLQGFPLLAVHPHPEKDGNTIAIFFWVGVASAEPFPPEVESPGPPCKR